VDAGCHGRASRPIPLVAVERQPARMDAVPVPVQPRIAVWPSITKNCQPWMETLFHANPDRVDWKMLSRSPERWMCLLFCMFPERLD
jgi:hypothetical protein